MKMAIKRKFTSMQKDEIRRKLAKVKKKMRDIKAYNRLLALRMYSQGTGNKAISEALEYSVQYISELVTKYINEGMDAIINDKRTSNNRRLNWGEEEEFLERFRETAEAGQLITVKEILAKYEEVTGEASGTSTIYALLKRHGWRKVKPRPENPKKASEEEIAASKKNSGKSTGYCWQKTGRSTTM
jgi:transposase